MQQLEFVRSRGKIALILLAAVPFIGVCYLMAQDPSNNWYERGVSWLGVLFFGAASLVGLRQLIRGGTVFVFDSNGITDRSNSLVFAWNELAACESVSVSGMPFLALTVRDREGFLRRLSPLKRIVSHLDERAGCGQWALGFHDVEPGVAAALEFIREQRSRARKRSSESRRLTNP